MLIKVKLKKVEKYEENKILLLSSGDSPDDGN